MSANTAYTLNTSSGSQTFTVDGLYADESYYFSIDAFNDEQDAKCIPVEVTPTSSTPTSAGVTIDDAEWMSSFPSVTVTGYSGPSDGVWVVFDSPSYCEPLLVETRGDDPFRMFYQNFVSGDTGGQGGQIPPVYVKTVVAATMSVPGTYEAYYPVFANNQDVGLQLTDGAQLSNQVECAIGAYSGNAYPIPTPPTLSATTDLGGDLVVTYTAGTHYGSSSTPTPYSNFYAIVDGTPVQMTRGTDYTDAGAGTMTVPATSEYAGDPVFAAFADELDGAYHDSQPYWSGESNIVGAGESGAPNAPTNLIAKGINLTSAFLHWTDNSDDESGFTIYMTFPTLTGVSWLQMGTTGSDADNFTVTVAELNNALGGQFFMYLPSNLLVEVVANNAAGPSIGNPIATVSMCPVDDNLFDRLNSDILGIAANAVHANTSLQNDIHFLQRVNFVFTQLSVNAILSQLFTSLTTDTAVAVAAVALTPEAEVAALEGAELIALWQVLQIEIPLMINSYYGDEIKSFQTDLIADSSNLAKVYTLIAGLLKASPGICNYTAFQGLQKYILQDQSTIKNDLLAS
jgi:hypothetical protein